MLMSSLMDAPSGRPGPARARGPSLALRRRGPAAWRIHGGLRPRAVPPPPRCRRPARRGGGALVRVARGRGQGPQRAPCPAEAPPVAHLGGGARRLVEERARGVELA